MVRVSNQGNGLYLPGIGLTVILGQRTADSRPTGIPPPEIDDGDIERTFWGYQQSLATEKYNIIQDNRTKNPFGTRVFFAITKLPGPIDLTVEWVPQQGEPESEVLTGFVSEAPNDSETAVLIGASLPVCKTDPPTIYLRKRPRGTFKGMYEIPGGHYDNFWGEVAGLDELMEEMGLDTRQIKDSKPLGILCTRVISTDTTGNPCHKNHVCLVWITHLSPESYEAKTETTKGWEPFTQEALVQLAKANELTPVAYLAIKAAGFI